jgi:hypothetical protein
MFGEEPDWAAARRRAPAILMTGPDSEGQERLRQIARDSGGVNYATRGNTRERFSQIIDDFRRSYVLHYSPAGVERTGWHDLKVQVVRSGTLSIRARRGYLMD